MEDCGVIDLCSRIEDLIYQDALKEYNLPESGFVWSKRECMIYYQEKCEEILRSLEFKKLNWKKIFEENEKNPRCLLNILLKDSETKVVKKPAAVGDPLKKIRSRAPKPPTVKKQPGITSKVSKKKSSENLSNVSSFPTPSKVSNQDSAADLKAMNISTAQASTSAVDMMTDLGNEEDDQGEFNLFDFDDGEDLALDTNLDEIIVNEEQWKS